MEEQLKSNLSLAIGEFSDKRAAILQLAYSEGGQAAVERLEQEYDALRNAYFEILQKQLDRNNHLYEQLTTVANEETGRLRASVGELAHINDIITLLGAVVSLVGRVLVVLAV